MPLFGHAFHAMGCDNQLQFHAETPDQARMAVDAAEAEVRRLEQRYSRYREDSVLSAINRAAGGAPVMVDEETAALLDYAATCHACSDGLFDITCGVLRRAWDFKAKRLPAQAEIDRLLPLVGWEKVQWRRPMLSLPCPGMELDLGGIVKEYAADRAAAICREHGIVSGLVNLGGDIHVIGAQPDGAPWMVGIRHPRHSAVLTAVPLLQGALASSGDYERYIEVGGQRYCHILDPRTGWPVQGLQAASVLADTCLIAGSAATIAMLKGDSDGSRFLDELALPNIRVRRSGKTSGSIRAFAPAILNGQG